MENNRMGYINRDENSVNNMIKIINYYLKFNVSKFSEFGIIFIKEIIFL